MDEQALRERLRGATVGIAGAGGLGSNVAMALARAGVGRLVIVDFDQHVEPETLRMIVQTFQLVLLECRHDQERRIGSDDPSLVDLARIDHEILTK